MDQPRMGVISLHCYPVKSCAGLSLTEARLEPRGIEHDREFMLVEAGGARFMTQRDHPRMALIRPLVEESGIRLEAPDMPPLEVPIDFLGPPVVVAVWKDPCLAVDQGEHAAGWLSEFLGISCRLVRMADGFARGVNPAYRVTDGDQVGFADAFPFLLISQEALDDLNTRLPFPVRMNRFRPNIVIAGHGIPYLEDRMGRIRVGQVEFDVAKPCTRCVITTTDQETTARGKEPLATLAKYRRIPGGVAFGQNLIHRTLGMLRVGDQVDVLDWKEARGTAAAG